MDDTNVMDVLPDMQEMQGDIPPIPLDKVNTLPPFPIEQLPPVLLNFVRYVSETTQVLPDIPAAMVLSVLSLCLQGKAKVRFSEHWSEEMNLYTLMIAPPGERKSAVFSMAMKPVYKYMNDYNTAHMADVQMYRSRKKALEIQLEKAIEKGADESKMREIHSQINSLQEVKELDLVTTDATPEALAALMFRTDEKMAIISPEGGVFDVISGMYTGNKVNLNIFLSGYDGEPVKIVRKSGSSALQHPLLTFGICAQPDVLNDVITNRQFIGRGLAQRFLYCAPDTLIGTRHLVTDYPFNAQEILRQYEMLVSYLLSKPADDEKIIDLTVAAADMFEQYADQIEYQMSDNNALADHRDYFSKLAGKTLRIAGLLHLCGEDNCITGDTMKAAIEITKYFGKQYLHIMCADNYNDIPKRLLDKMTARSVKTGNRIISLHEVKRLMRKISEEQLYDALDILLKKNCIFLIPVQPNSGAGNRKKESYRLNDHLFDVDKCTLAGAKYA